jgi:hypothetical protein
MTKVFAILVSALLMISTPASAGVNKTNDAFSEDISLIMEKMEKKGGKASQSYKSLVKIKIEFEKTFDKSWKMARHEFYDYASNTYDRINKIASDQGISKVNKPSWL